MSGVVLNNIWAIAHTHHQRGMQKKPGTVRASSSILQSRKKYAASGSIMYPMEKNRHTPRVEKTSRTEGLRISIPRGRASELYYENTFNVDSKTCIWCAIFNLKMFWLVKYKLRGEKVEM